ncbi:hypothetical protein KJ765_05925 [Candidatus Micrarchaeota archaeon]|nr:hypothetical protein [Candidatus Micrarchaeota archaeon]
MRRALVFFVFLFSWAHALVVVPPTVFFLTLSISSFLVNAVVSLLLFGALKGFTNRTYFGKSVFHLLSSGVSALGTAFLALSAMLVSAFLIYPLDYESAALSALSAGVLFLILKWVSAFRAYRNVPSHTKTSLVSSWVLLALFIAFATGVSSVLAMDVIVVNTDERIEYVSAYQESSPNSLIPDGWLPDLDASKGMAQAPSEPSEILGREDDALAEAKMDVITTAFTRMWFQPSSDGECRIRVGALEKTIHPLFACQSEEDGARKRIFCPVSVSSDELTVRGSVAFVASGSCSDRGTVFISDTGFERISS